MKRQYLLIAALVTTVMASAQSGIEQLFNELDARKDKSILSKIRYEDDSTHPTTFCHYDEMTIEKWAFGNLDKIFMTIFSNEQETYHLYQQLAGSSDTYQQQAGTVNLFRSPITIPYGPQNKYGVIFGTDPTHNYLVALFHDKNDSIKRHAYAITWYQQDKKIMLLRYHIYGDDPTRTNNQRVVTFDDNQLMYNDRYVVNGLGNLEVKIENDIDFMKRFGTLRASLVAANTADDILLRTGIVVKITELCKKYHQLLSNNERATCDKTLTELIKNYSFEDPFIKGMLEEARMALK